MVMNNKKYLLKGIIAIVTTSLALIFPTSALAATNEASTYSDKNVASVPKLDMEVMKNGKGDWGKFADNQIWDKVKYRLISTIPTKLKGYKEYTYKINDNLHGSHYNDKDFVIKVNDTEDKLDPSYYKINFKDDNGFELNIDI